MRRQRGFTLIELLVIIAILSVLVSILVPSLKRAGRLARQALCGSNLHNMDLAVKAYAANERAYIPLVFDEATRNPRRTTPLILTELGYTTLAAWQCPSDPRDTSEFTYTLADYWCSYTSNANHWAAGPPTPPWSWPQYDGNPGSWVRYNQIRRPPDVVWIFDGSCWFNSNNSNATDNRLVYWFVTYPGVYYMLRHGDGPCILFADGHVALNVDLLGLEDPENWAIE